MLENWLRPVNRELLDAPLDKEQLGSKIKRFEDQMPSLEGVHVALVGIDEEAADAVRRALYRLSFPFGKLEIADLGNVRKKENSFILPLLQELMDGKICPVVIGTDAKFSQSQYRAHFACQPSVSLVSIDERVAFHPRLGELGGHYFNPVLNGKTPPFYFTAIGCQSHFVDDETFLELEKINADCVRLGKAKANLPETEPFIRNADMVSFHLSALKSAEAPGVANASPNGFLSEEACQLSRYAGMNDKLTSIGFYGFDHKLDRNGQTAQVLAQLVWYFLDGFGNRKNDFPASMDGLVEYIVDFKGYDHPFTFWKSNKTGRWWLQVPVKTKKKHQRHRLIPCPYNDYLMASKGELPDRLLLAFKRFE
ncbi:MAG: arginase family protein [Bacteroidetes bacterium]|nr:arginase family protein [Bacteroidota bacterium]